MQRGKHYLVFLFLGLLFYSCSKDDSGIVTPFGSRIPIVTGLWLTLETGPEVIGSWGNPSDRSTYYLTHLNKSNPDKSSGVNHEVPIPTDLFMAVPYPNPTQGACKITFSLPFSAKVNIWIIKGRYINEKDNSLDFQNGAVCISSNLKPVKVMYDDEELMPGLYSALFDGNDNEGNPLPSGFYRVYFSINTFNEYHDIFIYRTFEDLPQGLSESIHNW